MSQLLESAAPTLAIFGLPGHWEAIVLLCLGVLIFGRRLPEVGRSVGRGIVEFKKGLKGIEDDIEDASSQPSRPASSSSAPAGLPEQPAHQASHGTAQSTTPAATTSGPAAGGS